MLTKLFRLTSFMISLSVIHGIDNLLSSVGVTFLINGGNQNFIP